MELDNIKLELIGINGEEVNPDIVDIIIKLIDERMISGNTYIGITKSLSELPIQYNNDEIIDGIVYSVRNLSGYKSYMNKHKREFSKLFNIKFDNYITVTVDNKKDYVKNSILFSTKNDCFIIKLEYPKIKENILDYNTVTKKLKKEVK